MVALVGAAWLVVEPWGLEAVARAEVVLVVAAVPVGEAWLAVVVVPVREVLAAAAAAAAVVLGVVVVVAAAEVAELG